MKQKRNYDVKSRGRDFRPGELVWVYNPIRKKGRSPKLDSKWTGPCKVLERMGEVVYRVQMPPRGRKVALHRDRLAPYRGGPPSPSADTQAASPPSPVAQPPPGSPLTPPGNPAPLSPAPLFPAPLSPAHSPLPHAPSAPFPGTVPPAAPVPLPPTPAGSRPRRRTRPPTRLRDYVVSLGAQD